MSNINTDQIKQYILKLIDSKDKDFAHKTVEYFGVSKSTVYNYVKKMCEENILKKIDKASPPYEIVTTVYKFNYNNDGTLGEDKIFRTDIQPPDIFTVASLKLSLEKKMLSERIKNSSIK